MAVKKSIFGSKSEKRGFLSIEGTWGGKYRIVPQFPWSALFEPDNEIGRNTSNLFYKTSVDYVLCTKDKDGEPLIAIDFDGMGKGFNRGEKYIQEVETSDRFRGDKFDFKLRYARKNNFPYYVIAGEEFEYLDEETNLTIVDGLIGYELAIRDFKDRMSSLLEERRDYMNNLPLHDQHEYIQDILLDEELDSYRKHSRIIQETEKVRNKVGAYGDKMSNQRTTRIQTIPSCQTLIVTVVTFSVALWKGLNPD